jgi:uncharacterized protein (DUF1499 family)
LPESALGTIRGRCARLARASETSAKAEKMARRRIVEDSISRLAIWSRRLGVFSFAVILLAIIIGRSGMLEIQPVLATFGAALVLAGAAILLALGAFAVIWRTGAAGFKYALTGMLLGIALIAYPAYLGTKGYQLPQISDITTDAIDPPRFEAIARLRTRQANPTAYAGLYTAELQHAAYPDIEPLLLTVNAQAAYEAARNVVTKRKWQVINERGPGGRREGLIEAVARTPIMGFRDDVVIRVRAIPGGARIDVRSASRYGRHDFGTNAARIRSLTDDIDEALGNEKPQRPARPAAKGAPAQKGAQPAKR